MLKKKVFRQILQYFQKNTMVSKENQTRLSAVTDYRKLLSLLNN